MKTARKRKETWLPRQSEEIIHTIRRGNKREKCQTDGFGRAEYQKLGGHGGVNEEGVEKSANFLAPKSRKED